MKTALVSASLSIFCAATLASCGQAQIKTTDAPATYGQWRSSQIGGGGYAQNVIPTSDPQVYYAYVDVGGVFRSDDGGQRWRMIHDTLNGQGAGVVCVRDLNVNPTNPNDVTIVCGSQWYEREGIYRTLDGGNSWNKAADAWFYGNESYRWAGQALARSPLNSKRMLAFSTDGMMLSSDGGANWNSVGLEGFFPSDLGWARDGQTVYACAQPLKVWRDGAQIPFKGGFFKSSDAGVTWTKIGDEAPTEMVQDPKNAARWWAIRGDWKVQVSDDSGQNWRDASQGLPIADQAPNSGEKGVFVADDLYSALGIGPDFLVVASNRGSFYRRDLGAASWEKMAAPKIVENYEGRPWMSRIAPGKWQHFGAATASITIDPRDPKHWFFTDWYAIYQSPDAGKTWNLSMDGVETTVLHTLRTQPNDAARVHLGMGDNGYMFSLDGGATFNSEHLNSNTKSIAIPASAPNLAYATGDAADGQWAAKQVWLSADAGRNWIKSPMRGLPADIRANSVVALPNAPKTVFVAVAGEVKPGAGGVYRSTDGGVTFNWFGLGLEGGGAFSDNIFGIGQELAALPNGEVLALSNQRQMIYRLKPGAEKWEVVGAKMGGKPYEVAAGADEFWVAVRDDGLVRVRDGAATRVWQGDAARVDFDNGRLALGAKTGVFTSLDGGQTWRNQAGLPNRFWPIVEWAGDRLLAGTIGNGAFWMPFTAAGLKTVVAQKVPESKIKLATATGDAMAPLPGEMQLTWTGRGQLEVASQDGARWLRSEGDAQGSMGVEFAAWSGARRFAGEAKIEGAPTEALVALQTFDAGGKQIGWQTLADAKNATDWTSFEGAATLPDGAAKVNLIAVFNGQGALGVRDVQMETATASGATASGATASGATASGATASGANASGANVAATPLAPRLLWTGAGQLEVSEDAGVYALKTAGTAQGSMGVEFAAWSGARRFAGEVKTEGAPTEALVALQTFDAGGKQIGWQTLADAKGATDWTKFSENVRLPDGAARAVFVAIFNGDGALQLRDATAETKGATANVAAATLQPKLLWKGEGTLDVTQNGDITALKTAGTAQGSMGVELGKWSGARSFNGEVKVEGQAQEAIVAIQIFDAGDKQIGWQTLTDAKSASDWTKWSGQVQLPDGAARAVLVAVFHGDGALSLRGAAQR